MAGGVLLAPALAQAQTNPGQPALPPPLDELATLPLRTQHDERSTLGVHLTPGPAVIAFWATWCSPCQAEGRELARIRTRVPAEQLAIIGVNMDRAETRQSDRVSHFMQRARMNYTQLWGDVAFYRAFNNPGDGGNILLPRLYVFAADGQPAAAFGRYDGAASLRQIARTVDAVLS
jgi:thiol-disulfide isomerase/thioredoxin